VAHLYSGARSVPLQPKYRTLSNRAPCHSTSGELDASNVVELITQVGGLRTTGIHLTASSIAVDTYCLHASARRGNAPIDFDIPIIVGDDRRN
jgi:hypothetical protein